MPIGLRLPYARIVACDFEYRAGPGDRPDVHCMVAQDLVSGQVWRLWRDDMGDHPPFPTDASTLFCAYYNGAEFNAFRALGWPLPERSIDLCAEFKALTNGVSMPNGRGLLGALLHFGLPHMDAIEKKSMQALAMRGGPYTEAETNYRRLLRAGRRCPGPIVRAAGDARAVCGPRPCPDVGSDALQGRLHGCAVRGGAPRHPPGRAAPPASAIELARHPDRADPADRRPVRRLRERLVSVPPVRTLSRHHGQVLAQDQVWPSTARRRCPARHRQR